MEEKNKNILELKKEIEFVWDKINEDVNQHQKTISSEKSLVFKFAWLFQHRNNDRIINIDFERPIYGVFTDGKFLDLFIEFKIRDKKYKIGFEFKFPNSKRSSTGQTQVRQKIINDIKRIDWLTSKNFIDLGVFLCATNEVNYTLNKARKVGSNFQVHHNANYKKGNQYPHNDKFYEILEISTDFIFYWKDHQNTKLNNFTFLNPIFINN